MNNATAALIRALEASMAHNGLHDRVRDNVVVALEDAVRALSAKAIMTAEDTALLDKIESMVLNLRIMGASAPRGKKGFGKPTL